MLLTSTDLVAEFRTSPAGCPLEEVDYPTRTTSGMPHCVIRLRTEHFTGTSVHCVSGLRAHLSDRGQGGKPVPKVRIPDTALQRVS
jgi:hypothetical protein